MYSRYFSVISILVLVTALFSCEKDANQGEIDRGLIEAYIMENQLVGTYSSSGLYYVIDEEGGTEHPVLASNVVTTFKEQSLDGVIYDEKEYFTETLSEKIPGVQEGLQLIGEGGSIILLIPSNLAYGSNGNDIIGPDEVIVYNVTLQLFQSIDEVFCLNKSYYLYT